MRRGPVGGFSLLELLVALAVFSIVALAAYSTLNALSRADQAQRLSARHLDQVQWALMRLDKDLAHSIAHKTRHNGELLPSFAGNADAVALVHAGRMAYHQISGQAHSDLQQVRWALAGSTLTRTAYGDPVQRTAPPTPVLENVRAIRFAYLDSAGRWHEQWLPNAAAGLPRAVRYRIETQDFGLLERLVELPGDRP